MGLGCQTINAPVITNEFPLFTNFVFGLIAYSFMYQLYILQQELRLHLLSSVGITHLIIEIQNSY